MVTNIIKSPHLLVDRASTLLNQIWF